MLDLCYSGKIKEINYEVQIVSGYVLLQNHNQVQHYNLKCNLIIFQLIKTS